MGSATGGSSSGALEEHLGLMVSQAVGEAGLAGGHLRADRESVRTTEEMRSQAE